MKRIKRIKTTTNKKKKRKLINRTQYKLKNKQRNEEKVEI